MPSGVRPSPSRTFGPTGWKPSAIGNWANGLPLRISISRRRLLKITTRSAFGAVLARAIRGRAHPTRPTKLAARTRRREASSITDTFSETLSVASRRNLTQTGFALQIIALRLAMIFHRAFEAIDVIFQLAAGLVEGVAHRDINILVGVMLVRVPLRDDLLAGHRQLDAQIIELALLVRAAGRFHDDFARHDIGKVFVQRLRALADLGLDRG